MATNGGTHKFNKNENNWLHKHFEPQQVDVVVSCIALDSLSTFARTHPLIVQQYKETGSVKSVAFSISLI